MGSWEPRVRDAPVATRSGWATRDRDAVRNIIAGNILSRKNEPKLHIELQMHLDHCETRANNRTFLRSDRYLSSRRDAQTNANEREHNAASRYPCTRGTRTRPLDARYLLRVTRDVTALRSKSRPSRLRQAWKIAVGMALGYREISLGSATVVRAVCLLEELARNLDASGCRADVSLRIEQSSSSRRSSKRPHLRGTRSAFVIGVRSLAIVTVICNRRVRHAEPDPRQARFLRRRSPSGSAVLTATCFSFESSGIYFLHFVSLFSLFSRPHIESLLYVHVTCSSVSSLFTSAYSRVYNSSAVESVRTVHQRDRVFVVTFAYARCSPPAPFSLPPPPPSPPPPPPPSPSPPFPFLLIDPCFLA